MMRLRAIRGRSGFSLMAFALALAGATGACGSGDGDDGGAPDSSTGVTDGRVADAAGIDDGGSPLDSGPATDDAAPDGSAPPAGSCPANATFCANFETPDLPMGAIYNSIGGSTNWLDDFAIDNAVSAVGNGS